MRISYWSSDVCSYYIVDHHEAVRHARPRQVDAHPEAVLAASHRRPRAGRSIKGQKSNPIGLRLQINRTWNSRWFAEGAAYGRLPMEDLKTRKYIVETLPQAAHTKEPGRGSRKER